MRCFCPELKQIRRKTIRKWCTRVPPWRKSTPVSSLGITYVHNDPRHCNRCTDRTTNETPAGDKESLKKSITANHCSHTEQTFKCCPDFMSGGLQPGLPVNEHFKWDRIQLMWWFLFLSQLLLLLSAVRFFMTSTPLNRAKTFHVFVIRSKYFKKMAMLNQIGELNELSLCRVLNHCEHL